MLPRSLRSKASARHVPGSWMSEKREAGLYLAALQARARHRGRQRPVNRDGSRHQPPSKPNIWSAGPSIAASPTRMIGVAPKGHQATFHRQGGTRARRDLQACVIYITLFVTSYVNLGNVSTFADQRGGGFNDDQAARIYCRARRRGCLAGGGTRAAARPDAAGRVPLRICEERSDSAGARFGKGLRSSDGRNATFELRNGLPGAMPIKCRHTGPNWLVRHRMSLSPTPPPSLRR
jgi:hypothetical protein